MKRWLILTCLASSAFIVSAQTIFIANNNPGAVTGVNVFTGNSAVADACKGAGEGAIDMRAFGGPTPSDLFGTSLPVVQAVIAPATVTQGTDMDVRVKGKGN